MAKSLKSIKPRPATQRFVHQEAGIVDTSGNPKLYWIKEIKVVVDLAAVVRELRKGVVWSVSALGAWQLMDVIVKSLSS